MLFSAYYHDVTDSARCIKSLRTTAFSREGLIITQILAAMIAYSITGTNIAVHPHIMPPTTKPDLASAVQRYRYPVSLNALTLFASSSSSVQSLHLIEERHRAPILQDRQKQLRRLVMVANR